MEEEQIEEQIVPAIRKGSLLNIYFFFFRKNGKITVKFTVKTCCQKKSASVGHTRNVEFMESRLAIVQGQTEWLFARTLERT